MKRTGPDTSLYKPRPISAPKTRLVAMTGTTVAETNASAAAPNRPSSDGGTTTATSTVAGRPSASAITAASIRLSKPTASRTAASTTTVASTTPSTLRLSRSAPSITTASTTTTRPVTRSAATSSSAARAAVSTVTSASARKVTRPAAIPSSRSTVSATRTTRTPTSGTTVNTTKRVTGKPAVPSQRHAVAARASARRTASSTNNNNQDDLKNNDASGYPACLEIEDFEDAMNASDSAYAMLAANAGELNIITAVRLRPMSSAEKLKGYRRIVDMPPSEHNLVRIVNPVALAASAQYTPLPPSSASTTRLTASSEHTAAEAAEANAPAFPPQFTHEFRFDHTFWSFDRDATSRSVASQRSIYDQLGVFMIENALQGFNCSVFAYGQTSAGKTYTMMGSDARVSAAGSNASSVDADTTKRDGLIPRICRGMFERLELDDDDGESTDYSVHVSYIEIYHEHAYDLLQAAALATAGSSSSSSTNSIALSARESLKVRESPEIGVFVERANHVRVTSFTDIKVLIDEGTRVRSVATTSANARSSRSHAVLTLTLKRTLVGATAQSEVRRSKICLVDLAGSERADASGTSGARLREAGSINKSLATLGDVIGALSKRSLAAAHHHQHGTTAETHFVPYRNSLLTRLLKESLGGNAKTIMLAAISPCDAHYDETLSTLKYIERARTVVNVVRVNAESSSTSTTSSSSNPDLVRVLQREIDALKAQLEVAAASTLALPPSPLAPSTAAAVRRSVDDDDDKDDDDDDGTDKPQVMATSVSPTSIALALELEDELTASPSSPSTASGRNNRSAPGSMTSTTDSPVYATSLHFDEREKGKLEREVAKLKVQLRKREREFQTHELALSEKALLQTHVSNVLALHDKFVSLVKLRALAQWRFNATAMSMRVSADRTSYNGSADATATSDVAVNAVVDSADKNVMTDAAADNNPADASAVEFAAAIARRGAMDRKRDAFIAVAGSNASEEEEEEEDPACSPDDDDDDDNSQEQQQQLELKPAPSDRVGKHSNNAAGAALISLSPTPKRGFAIAGRQHVDVMCSSIVTDFFGDSVHSPLAMPKLSGLYSDPASSTSRVVASKALGQTTLKTFGKRNASSSSNDNNQLEQLVLLPTDGDDDDDDGAHPHVDDDEVDDRTDSIRAKASASRATELIDAIIDHDADESNQIHDVAGQTKRLMSVPEELDEMIGDGDDDEDETNDHEIADGDDAFELDDSIATVSPVEQWHAYQQRSDAKLARCIDAIDIARKSMGPTVRKLKYLTDRSAIEYDGSTYVAASTGLERQLLVHADRTLVAVHHHASDLIDAVASARVGTDSSDSDSMHHRLADARIDCELYDQYEALLSDFCLQTLGHVCDQLTAGAAGTSALVRDALDTQLNVFQGDLHNVLAAVVCAGTGSKSDASAGTSPSTLRSVLLVASLMELFALSERIRFAWYAIDQKNRQRMALHTLSQHQHAQALAGSNATTSHAKIAHLEAQAKELQTTNDELVTQLATQRADFAQREEDDRIALLLSAHKLETEHAERVADLECALRAATASLRDVETQLLAQTSRVEQLEHELEHVRSQQRQSSNTLLPSDSSDSDVAVSSSSDSDASALPIDAPALASSSESIIVKLEHDLESALHAISELEPVASGIDSNTDDGANKYHSLASAIAAHDLQSLAIVESMERMSENGQLIAALDEEDIVPPSGLAMSAHRRLLGATDAMSAGDSAAMFTPVADSSMAVASGSAATLSHLQSELVTALARAETLEEQHMKLMVSFETQTDHVVLLEAQLYDAQEHSKTLDDALAAVRAHLNTAELALEVANERAQSLQVDLDAAMSELCVTESKCNELETQCSDLAATAQASADAVATLQCELDEVRSRVEASVVNDQASTEQSLELEHASLEVLQERCTDLEAALTEKQQRCLELERDAASAAAMHSDTLAAAQQRVASSASHHAALQAQCQALETQQQGASALTQSLRDELLESQAQTIELQAQMQHRDEELLQLALDSGTAQQARAALEREVAALRDDLTAAQAIADELRATNAELTVSAQSQAELIQRLEAEAATIETHATDLVASQQRQQKQYALETQQLTSTLNTSLQRVAQLEAQYSELLRVCDELRLRHGTAEARCVEREAQCTALQQRSNAAELELTSLQQTHQVSIERLKQQVAALQAQELASAARESELVTLQQTHREAVAAMECQVANLQTQNAELQAQSLEAAATQAERTAQQQQLERDVVILTTQNTSLQAQVLALERVAIEVATLQHQSQSDSDSLAAQITALQAYNASLQADVAAAQAETVTQQQQRHLDAAAAEAQHTSQQAQLANLESHSTALQADVNALEATQAELTTLVHQRELDIGSMEQRIAALQSLNADLETQRQARDTADDEYTTQQQQQQEQQRQHQLANGILEEQITMLQAQIGHEQALSSGTLAQNAELQAQIMELGAQRTVLLNERELAHAHLTDAQDAALVELHAVRDQLVELHALNASAHVQIAGLEEQNNDLRHQSAELQHDLELERAHLLARDEALVELSAARQQQLIELHTQHADATALATTQSTTIATLTEQRDAALAERDALGAAMNERKTHATEQTAVLTQQLEMATSAVARLEAECNAQTTAAAAYVTQIEALQTQHDSAQAISTAIADQRTELLSELELARVQLVAHDNVLIELIAAREELVAFHVQHADATALASAQTMSIATLSEQLASVQAQRDALEATALQHTTSATEQVAVLTTQLEASASDLAALELAHSNVVDAVAANVVQIDELQQELLHKTSALETLAREHSDAVASASVLTSRVVDFETQLVAATVRVQSLEDALTAASTHVQTLEQVASSATEATQRRARDLESRLETAQLEFDIVQHRVEQLQTELADAAHVSAAAQSALETALAASRTRAVALEANSQTRIQALQDEHDTLVLSHAAELEAVRAELHAAQESSTLAGAQSTVKHARLLADQEAAHRRSIQQLELQLESAQRQANEFGEAFDTQTLVLAQAEDACAAAVTRADKIKQQLVQAEDASAAAVVRADALEQQLAQAEDACNAAAAYADTQTLLLAQAEDACSAAIARTNELEQQMCELQDNHREQLNAMQADAAATSDAIAADVDVSAARIRALEHQIHEMSWESGESELQLSLEKQQHERALNEAQQLATRWQVQYAQRCEDAEATERDFDAKSKVMAIEIAAHVASMQVLQQRLEQAQSDHTVALTQLERKHCATIKALRTQLDAASAAASASEHKCRELEACVSPDGVRAVQATLAAAQMRVNEAEATYRIELESKLQLEFDLASAHKELRETQQQLAELQWHEVEADANDPTAATRRSRARENELAMLAKERDALHLQVVQVAKREGAVKLLEASANSRFADMQHQLETHKRELDNANKTLQAERLQSQEQLRELAAQLSTRTERLAEVTSRSEMQREELLSSQTRTTLSRLVRTASAYAMESAADDDDDGSDAESDGDAGILTHKVLTPEARRLLLKHLNSLDLWFERAILGKTPDSEARRSTVRRASLLAVIEDNELLVSSGGAATLPPPAPVALVTPANARGGVNKSIASTTAVSVALSVASEVDRDDVDLEVMFDRDMERSESQANLASPVATASIGGGENGSESRRGVDTSGTSATTTLSEVAQLKLTVVRLKQSLDAKEDAVRFLDAKMRYYEDLLQHVVSSSVAASLQVATNTPDSSDQLGSQTSTPDSLG